MLNAVMNTLRPPRIAHGTRARPKVEMLRRTLGACIAIVIVMATASNDLQAGPSIRPTNESGNECLVRANQLVEQDKYDDAAPWYRAAVQRATDPKTQELAQTGLDVLPMLGKPAPALQTMKWIVGIPVALQQLRGKVVLLHFFDIITSESLEAQQQVAQLAVAHRAAGLRVIGIASAGEHQEYQRPDRIEAYTKRIQFGYSVAIDADLTRTLRAYHAGGTPFSALIDRKGRIRWLGYFDRAAIDKKSRQLLDEGQKRSTPVPMPESREGRELIGKPAPPLVNKTWLNTKRGRPPETSGRPLLIRFWMNDCPYCRATGPSLRKIQKDYAERDLAVIGAYHPKPAPKNVPPHHVQTAARELGFEFPIFLDNDWQYLQAIWLASGEREFTSASFLIDRNGIVRFIHPGPDFYPSNKKSDRLQNDDYQSLRQAIEAVLAE